MINELWLCPNRPENARFANNEKVSITGFYTSRT